MQTLILSLHVIVCVTLVILVLLQAGKEGMGVIFGGGNASVFGSSGAGGLLAKMTAFMAVLFIVTSLSLPLPLPRFPQPLLKSPLRLPLPTSPPTKHHPKYAFEAMSNSWPRFLSGQDRKVFRPSSLISRKSRATIPAPVIAFLAHSSAQERSL